MHGEYSAQVAVALSVGEGQEVVEFLVGLERVGCQPDSTDQCRSTPWRESPRQRLACASLLFFGSGAGIPAGVRPLRVHLAVSVAGTSDAAARSSMRPSRAYRGERTRAPRLGGLGNPSKRGPVPASRIAWPCGATSPTRLRQRLLDSAIAAQAPGTPRKAQGTRAKHQVSRTAPGTSRDRRSRQASRDKGRCHRRGGEDPASAHVRFLAHWSWRPSPASGPRAQTPASIATPHMALYAQRRSPF